MSDATHTAFFSYSREDSDFALRLAEALKAAGADVWLDQLDISPGQHWDRSVGAALANCSRMLVILSPASVNSENVMDEVSFALEEKKTVIPVICKDCSVPFRLRRLQYVDFRHEYSRGLAGLLRTLVPEQKPGEDARVGTEIANEQQADVAEANKRERAAQGRRRKAAEEERQAAKQPRLAQEPEGTAEQARVDTLGAMQIVGREFRTLRCHKASMAVAVSGDGRLALSASADQTLKVWDIKTGRKLHILRGHTDSVFPVAISGNGRRAVSGSVDDTTLKVWDVETGRELRALEGHTDLIVDVAVNEGGQLALSTSADKTIKVWDLQTGRELRTLGRTGLVNYIAMTRDGRLALSGRRDGTLQVWEVGTGHQLRSLRGHTGPVHNVAMSRDGRRAVSASDDTTLKVWDVETWCELRILEGHTEVYSLAVSGNGRLVAASEKNTLKVWDVETGALVLTFTFNAELTSCAFIGDDQLAAGDEDGYLHFLRVETPTS